MLEKTRENDAAQQRRMRRRFRKGVFVVPSLLTTANIFCGFYSVMESLGGVQALSANDLARGDRALRPRRDQHSLLLALR